MTERSKASQKSDLFVRLTRWAIGAGLSFGLAGVLIHVVSMLLAMTLGPSGLGEMAANPPAVFVQWLESGTLLFGASVIAAAILAGKTTPNRT